MSKTLITNTRLVSAEGITEASVLIDGPFIEEIFPSSSFSQYHPRNEDNVVNGEGKLLFPGIIDDQVHFREPGLTHKGDIFSESRAAVAGGITSFMEMPNTNPQTLTQKLLSEKFRIGQERSLANYSFYMGASNENIEEIRQTDPKSVCGIKVFMGASTGNMLVDNPDSLLGIFAKSPCLVAVHCEDETTIRKNLEEAKRKFGDEIQTVHHPQIRDEKACLRSSSLAVSLAREHNTRLHILHLSTAAEMSLFETIPLSEKRITAEVCVHHLWFSDKDYPQKGNWIKWNPAIKSEKDKDALLKALIEGRIDVVATDHAPHTAEEKSRKYTEAPSGGPLVQHSLTAMLELYHRGQISLELIAEKMCHNPAILFQIDRRGFIRQGYFADLTLVDLNSPWQVSRENVLYKCGWSPFEGTSFTSKISYTFVNGKCVYSYGKIYDMFRGMRLMFNRN